MFYAKPGQTPVERERRSATACWSKSTKPTAWRPTGRFTSTVSKARRHAELWLCWSNAGQSPRIVIGKPRRVQGVLPQIDLTLAGNIADVRRHFRVRLWCSPPQRSRMNGGPTPGAPRWAASG